MSNNERADSNEQADDIAKKIIDMLVEAFRAREAREPTGEEVEMMLSELTEERVASMMSGEDVEAIESHDIKDENPVVDNKEEAPVPQEEDKENYRRNGRSSEEEAVDKEEEDAVVKPIVNPFGFTPASIAVQPEEDLGSKRQKLSE